jgi:ribosomal protein L32
MKFMNKYVIKVLATGFAALVVLSILLFWARKTCQALFYENLVVGKTAQVKIQPSGLLPELDNAPEVVIKSSIDAYIGDGVVLHSLGIIRDFWALSNGKSSEFCVSRGDKKKGNYNLILFDKKSGLFVFYDVIKAKRGWDRKPILYAGPKGVSETPDKNLGRFSEPRNNLWEIYADSLIFFDKSHSCFFQIGFVERTVAKSPQISEIIQIGGYIGFDKDGDSLGPLTWSPPLRKQTGPEEGKKKIMDFIQDKDGTKINLVSAAEEGVGAYSKQDILVLESNGTIRILNSKTLEISEPVGFLPSGVDSVGRANPEKLFAYVVQPFVVNDEYSGTIAASISREAMEIQVAVFNKEGKLIEREGAYIDPFSMAWGPTLTIITYLLENLQPALTGLISYSTASTFEAVDGHTGLFILPNSTVAMYGRYSKGIVGPLFAAMTIISPSIVLGILLSFAVYKDATVTGFSNLAKRYWLFGTILFGLSAYIAYRLTKPKETLVTCQNCGKMRRPDMLRCQHCGGKWHIPELIPPTWRVITEPDKKV